VEIKIEKAYGVTLDMPERPTAVLTVNGLYKLLPLTVATPAGNANSKEIRVSNSVLGQPRFDKKGAFPVSVFSVNQRQIFPCPRDPVRWILRVAIISATMLISLPAFAGLGDDVSSVQADQVHMQGSLRTTQAQAYTVHEIQAPTGIVVREYVSPTSGKVFAVAWQGPWPPDMRQILSNYFRQYQQAAQAQATSRAGRHPLLIQEPGLVVQAGGHMRSFAGRAYVPEMLPQGVSAEAIR
jgi:hypothetical protein